MNDNYFNHESTGKLVYDAEGHWARVMCDRGIVDYYWWLAKKYGKVLQKGSAVGSHVTFIRGEPPPKPELWGLGDGQEIVFRYSHCARYTDWHLWLDVYSDKLNEIRAKLGYPPKPEKRLSDGRVFSQSYHLTIGRVT